MYMYLCASVLFPGEPADEQMPLTEPCAEFSRSTAMAITGTIFHPYFSYFFPTIKPVYLRAVTFLVIEKRRDCSSRILKGTPKSYHDRVLWPWLEMFSPLRSTNSKPTHQLTLSSL